MTFKKIIRTGILSIITSIAFYSANCANQAHSPYNVYIFKDINSDSLSDSLIIEHHDVIKKDSSKLDNIVGTDRIDNTKKLTEREARDFLPLNPTDKLFFEYR